MRAMKERDIAGLLRMLPHQKLLDLNARLPRAIAQDPTRPLSIASRIALA